MRIRRDVQVEATVAVVLAIVVLLVSPGAAVDAIVAGVLLVLVLGDLGLRRVRRRREHAAPDAGPPLGARANASRARPREAPRARQPEPSRARPREPPRARPDERPHPRPVFAEHPEPAAGLGAPPPDQAPVHELDAAPAPGIAPWQAMAEEWTKLTAAEATEAAEPESASGRGAIDQ